MEHCDMRDRSFRNILYEGCKLADYQVDNT